MPKVSVIIPCYNHGEYIYEAIESVKQQTFKNYEIIVINDGSTDQKTLEILDSLDKFNIQVHHIKNQGPSVARNEGIAISKGTYILPLDADDKIGKLYLEKAVKVLDSNSKIGIVYCLAKLFGIKNKKLKLPAFDYKKMIVTNLIFNAGFYRRSDWERVNGYNVNMLSGLEDWDFWLSLLELNVEVHQIQDYLFYYRIKKNSRNGSIDFEKRSDLHRQLFINHIQFFIDNIDGLFDAYYRLEDKNNTIAHRIVNKILY
jgi:glycosyltransferase involved in cell wall biosynthesis